MVTSLVLMSYVLISAAAHAERSFTYGSATGGDTRQGVLRQAGENELYVSTVPAFQASRDLLQANASAAVAPALNITGNITAGNATDDQARRRGRGDGNRRRSYRRVESCGSINCLRRQLLQAVRDVPAAIDNITSSSNATDSVVTGDVTAGNATIDQERRRGHHSGDGGHRQTYRPDYCGSISCLRRKLLQTVPAASNTTTSSNNITDSTVTGNATAGNVTDDQARRHGHGDGSRRETYRPDYCGSISCLRRKLLQALAGASKSTPAASETAGYKTATAADQSASVTAPATEAFIGINGTNATAGPVERY